jgi:hypothetical protein
MPYEGPQKLASQVYEFIKLNSFHITTLPVASFALWTLNDEPWKLKFGHILSYIIGKTCSLRRLSYPRLELGTVQPYMKISFYRE